MPRGHFSEPPKTFTIAWETDYKCICGSLGVQSSGVAKRFIHEICFLCLAVVKRVFHVLCFYWQILFFAGSFLSKAYRKGIGKQISNK